MKQLKVERNQTYALILKPNGQEIIRLVNPKKLEEIIRLLKETLPKKVKREKTRDLGLIVIDDLPETIGWVTESGLRCCKKTECIETFGRRPLLINERIRRDSET